MTHSYRNLFLRNDVPVPLLQGGERTYVNFDNAASTPAMDAVVDVVDQFMRYYSSVHRGTGFKSQLSTHAYEEARERVLHFVGGVSGKHVVIFGKNTTEAINKLANRFPFTPERNVVLVSLMEHHSNDLPWRKAAKVVHIRALPDGRIDEADFDARLAQFAGQVALVAVTGASNVTGFLNPIHRLAEKAHAAGAQFLADCAQMAPHRAVRMGDLDDPAHLDFVTLSAHKMYAPYGTGALVARRDVLEQGDPEYRGGGQVEMVTLDEVYWSQPPDRDESGSPNTVGAVALGAAIAQLEQIGMEAVAAHEAELTAVLLKKLPAVPGLHIFGDANPETTMRRVGVVPFEIRGMPHALVAAILGYEFGVGVRHGCFCAHPYILHLLEVRPGEVSVVRRKILEGDRRDVPGLIRASFGLYNDEDEIDYLVECLQKIARGEYHGDYQQERSNGEFHPKNWSVDFKRYFQMGVSL